MWEEAVAAGENPQNKPTTFLLWREDDLPPCAQKKVKQNKQIKKTTTMQQAYLNEGTKDQCGAHPVHLIPGPSHYEQF